MLLVFESWYWEYKGKKDQKSDFFFWNYPFLFCKFCQWEDGNIPSGCIEILKRHLLQLRTKTSCQILQKRYPKSPISTLLYTHPHAEICQYPTNHEVFDPLEVLSQLSLVIATNMLLFHDEIRVCHC